MKIISIGRGDGCRIIIDDPRVSRQHAILRINPLGKMEIIDQSQNGTWVNGVKLRSNTPFPVKRKDVVNFAGASQLNWSLIPDPLKYVKFGLLAALAVILLTFAIVFLSRCASNRLPEPDRIETPAPAKTQGKETVTTPTIKKTEKNVGEEAEEEDTSAKKVKGGKSINELFPVAKPVTKPVAKPQPTKVKKTGDKGKKDTKEESTEERKGDRNIAL